MLAVSKPTGSRQSLAGSVHNTSNTWPTFQKTKKNKTFLGGTDLNFSEKSNYRLEI